MAWAFISNDEKELAALEELGMLWDAPDRIVAVIGGSIVERRLEIAVREQLISHKVIDPRMWTGVGPLASFSAKINLGYMLGLYGHRAWRELIILKDIRNSFAHDLDVSLFSEQRIANLCRNLSLVELCYYTEGGIEAWHATGAPFCAQVKNIDAVRVPRTRFIATMCFFSYCLL